MSANNQTLIKEHEGKYYIFSNIMAESWDEKNELKVSEAEDIALTLEDAYKKARQIESLDPTEYGVQVDELQKDGAEITLLG